MTLALVLLIAALVFAILSLAGVPSRVDWTALGLICVVVYLLLGSV